MIYCVLNIIVTRPILRLNENTHLYPFYCVSFIPELSVRIILRYSTRPPSCTTPQQLAIYEQATKSLAVRESIKILTLFKGSLKCQSLEMDSNSG